MNEPWRHCPTCYGEVVHLLKVQENIISQRDKMYKELEEMKLQVSGLQRKLDTTKAWQQQDSQNLTNALDTISKVHRRAELAERKIYQWQRIVSNALAWEATDQNDVARDRLLDAIAAYRADKLPEVQDMERLYDECLKIAESHQSYSPQPNPSDMDRGWKACARDIAESIRQLKQTEKR